MADGVYYADLTNLAHQLAQASGTPIEFAAATVVGEAAIHLQAQAAQNAPRRTGALAASITVTMPNPTTAVIGPTSPYGGFVEFGTAPHIIRPRNKKVLRFQVGGKTVFASVVHHPGTKPHPYMAPALTQTLDWMEQNLAKTGMEVLNVRNH